MGPTVSGFFAGIGIQEILVILVVALILFGNRLPEVARSLGKGYMEFRKSLQTLESQIRAEDVDVEVSDAKTPEAGAGSDSVPGKKGSGHGTGAGPGTGTTGGGAPPSGSNEEDEKKP
jgi:TatA/E family protein of Tat protein translocase